MTGLENRLRELYTNIIGSWFNDVGRLIWGIIEYFFLNWKSIATKEYLDLSKISSKAIKLFLAVLTKI